MQLNQPIIVFDGICNLCHKSIDFVMKHDNKKQFSFVTLQSENGKKLMKEYQIPKDIDSVILIIRDEFYHESDAAIEIANLLPYPWKLATIFQIIPKKLRNKLYQWIAKNRYRWFGKKESCGIPNFEE